MKKQMREGGLVPPMVPGPGWSPPNQSEAKNKVVEGGTIVGDQMGRDHGDSPRRGVPGDGPPLVPREKKTSGVLINGPFHWFFRLPSGSRQGEGS